MRRLFWILALGLSLTSLAAQAQSKSETDLWSRWKAHDSDSTATIDNSAYNAFLKKYVVDHQDGSNGVRYKDVSDADRDKLEAYIEQLEKVDIDHYNRHVQRAYWLNLYNAETIDLILDNYPLDSIRDLGGILHHGPWQKKVLEVEDKKLTLNDIARRILRPIWHDGMSLYGISCGAVSCPSLRGAAYTGSNVDKALRQNAKDYVNSPEGVRFDDNRLTLSKIYDWYADDFGGSARGILNHIRRFATPSLSARLDAARGDIDDYTFDWSINSQANVSDHKANNDSD